LHGLAKGLELKFIYVWESACSFKPFNVHMSGSTLVNTRLKEITKDPTCTTDSEKRQKWLDGIVIAGMR
jgi:hypothetical protein